MPLQSTSQDYKEYLMKNRGIDSTQFNLDDDGNVVPRILEQPVLNDSEKPIIDPSNLPNAKPQTTVGGTLVHGALNSALPTAAGLGVAGLASLALAPETGGLSLLGLLGTGIAGATAGGATSAIQDKLMPDSFKQQLQQEASDNPVASFVGRNIPQALAFNPLTGAKNLAQAISTGGKSVAPDFAKSVISNMGISGGIDAAQQLASGQPFSFPQLGESVGTAALFNQPNALGRKLMFEPQHQPLQGEPAIPKTVEQIMAEGSIPSDEHSTTPHEGNLMPETLEGLGNVREAFNKTKDTSLDDPFDLTDRSETKTTSDPENKEIGGLAGLGNLADAFPNHTKINEQANKEIEAARIKAKDEATSYGLLPSREATLNRKDAMSGYKGTKEPVDINTFEGEGGIVPNEEVVSQTGILTAKQAELEEAHSKLVAEQKKTAEAVAALEKSKNEVAKPIAVGESAIPASPNTGVDENKLNYFKAKNRQETSGEYDPNIKYQDEPASKTKEESAFLYRNASPSYKKAVQQLMIKRGISLHEAVNLINPSTGKEVLGQTNIANRDVTLNPAKAEVDTPIHEVSHQFLDDLSKSSDPTDRKLAADAQAIFKGHVKGAEEGTAIDQGLRGANRLATSLEGTPIERARGWAKDFMSRWKYNLNLHSDEDVSRHLSQRIQTDAPSFGYENKGVPAVQGDDRNRMFKGIKLNQEYIKPLVQYGDKIETSPQLTFKDGVKLKDLLNTPELFNKYPNIADYTVHNKDYSSGYSGIDHNNKRIHIVSDTTGESQTQHLLHEVAHAVQHTSGEESGLSYLHKNYESSPSEVEARKLMDHGSSVWKNTEDEYFHKNNIKSPDRLLYEELTKQFKDAKDEPSRLAIQQQMEDIKNKNGGMPPKYQDESAISKNDKSLGITRSALDDIMKKDGPEAKPIVDAISRYYPKRDEIRARYSKSVYDAAKGMSEDSQNRVEQALLDARTSNSSQVDTLTSDKEKNLYKIIRDTLDLIPKDRNAANMPVRAFNNKGESYLRQAKSDPNYMYNQMSPKVIEALSANRNSAESLAYKKAFLDHQIKYGTTQEQAKAMWDNMTKAYDKGASSQDHFRGLDIEQGAGLPSELMRPGLLRNFDRYINRVSSARAFHDTIESNNEVASKLGYKTTPWNKPLPESDFHSPRVNEVLNHIKGEQFDPEEAKVKGWNRVATSLMLGPLTNIHIAASSLANSLSYFRPSEIAGAVTHMITDFHNGVQHALENGSLVQKRQIFSDLVNAHSTSLEKLNGLADGISRLNGRSATEYITKGILQSAGEHLVSTRIPLAQAGDSNAVRLIKHIDPDFSPIKKYDEKEVARLASNFSGLLHGKHDARTMPAWMLHETALQPFFSLASWSIGQTNTFMKHVVTPAINEHNYTPLLMSTLGAGLGGYVIKELREGLSNKKSPIPSFNEIANSPRGVSGNLPLVGYNLAAMASFAGYAGILSTGVKSLFDIKYKNAPQGATFPLDEVAGNVLKTASQASAALMNTSDPKEYVKIGTKAMLDILRENIQTARIASSWGDEVGLLGKDREYKKKLNVEEDELRRYKITAGLPITDESTAGADNPYYQENRKAFKHTLDLKEAAKQVPDLVKQAVGEATIDGHINPEILREKLKALKGSSYPSMPNPDNAPLQFYNYLNFLKKSKGDSYAQQHLIEYMKNNEIGKIRSSLIPSI